jgi:hypothetical protein
MVLLHVGLPAQPMREHVHNLVTVMHGFCTFDGPGMARTNNSRRNRQTCVAQYIESAT